MSENENSIPSDKPIPVFFSMVVAEVIFETEHGVASRRKQLFTEFEREIFPAHRLNQILNNVSQQVRNELKQAKKFEVHEVLFLAIHPLGWMTYEEFYGGKEEAEKAHAEKAQGIKIVVPKDADTTNVVGINGEAPTPE